MVANAHGQVLYTTPGSTTSQNFTGLAVNTANSSTPAGTFVNNSTVPGWSFITTGPSVYYKSSGNGAPTGLYSYGPVSNPERALGLVTNRTSNGTAVTSSFGVEILNNTGGGLKALQVSYTGEQWHRGSDVSQSLLFSYSTNATSLSTGTWTSVSSLNFASIKHGDDAAADGNLASNRQALSGFIPPTLTSGSSLWFKWTMGSQATGTSNGLAVDDFNFKANAVPEPFSMITLGLGAIGVMVRRKKRN